MANPPEGLTSAGCAPKFPPGCDCEYCWSPHYQAGQLTPCSGDPEASAEDSTCSADESCVQCKCLPLGCDCDPNAEDPNSFCPSGDVCKVITSAPGPSQHISHFAQDCQCQPPFPPGCDCDPGADDPNESCSAGNECVQCVCLPRGCDCDPSAEDPDSFCPAGEKCGDRNKQGK